MEAQQAAISAFGSVRAVVRAHQTGRAKAVATLNGCAMTSWKLAGLFLLAFSVTSLAGLADIKMRGQNTVPLTGPALPHLAAGIAGLLLLTGYHLVRRFRRRGMRAATAPAARYFPLVAVIVFGTGTMTQILLRISGAAPAGWPTGWPTIPASLALAAGYAVRVGTLRTRRPRDGTA